MEFTFSVSRKPHVLNLTDEDTGEVLEYYEFVPRVNWDIYVDRTGEMEQALAELEKQGSTRTAAAKEAMAALVDYATEWMLEDSKARLQETGIELPMLTWMVQRVQELYAQRPTGQPGDSPKSPGNKAPKSSAFSASKASR